MDEQTTGGAYDRTEAGRGWDRRRAVALGALALGAPAVAACGGGDSGSGPAVDKGQKLIGADEVPVGSGVVVEDRKLVVTQPEKGTFKAFSNVCTHQGCPMSKVEKTIDCTCHGSRFSLTDGSPVAGPAQKDLPETAVRVVDGTVVAD